MTDPVLSTYSLTKQFGGLFAVDDVSLQFTEGRIHAIVGPNGAGKSTLVNLLSGELLPTRGRIEHAGKDITRLSTPRRSQLGIGRSFQITNIFSRFTCFENCWLAAQSRLPSSMRFIRPARRLKDVEERTCKWLDTCGLLPRKDTVASALSYGEQRQLEIAMVLATEPTLLLLDEPMAGMGTEESGRLVSLLRMLAGDYTLILVDHDMDAVFAIADTLTVMTDGRVLDSGPLEQVRGNAAVQEAYLGHTEAIQA
jgi:branched-chain amino acid transport system ATP-binding protein